MPDTGPPKASRDPLTGYRDKRDPAVTNEPFGVTRQPAAYAPRAGEKTWTGDFVIHLHAATRRHHDLRMQIGGTLMSFAVPRGPSLNPADKRLAVQTENHPIEYLDFEDVIPEQNYGAGPMIVWDIGRVRYLEQCAEEGLSKGKLDFELYGHKVNGRFALVETTARMSPKPKQRQWLLLKKQDAYSKTEGDVVSEFPESVLSGLRVEQLEQRPQLEQALLEVVEQAGAQRREVPFDAIKPMLCASNGAELNDPARLYELKLDGVRILAKRRGTDVELVYRTHRSATHSYPEVKRALQLLFAREFVIDGEIVCFDEKGKPNFQRLAPRIHAQKPFDVRRAAAQAPVVYLVFDLLQLGHWDLRGLPLEVRKGILARLTPKRGVVRFLDHLVGDGQPLFELCKQQGLEGVVSKRKDAVYVGDGTRSELWVKHKCERDDEFVVVGWVEGKGSRELGALELASYAGSRLIYRGRVGSGFDESTLRMFSEKLRELAADTWASEGEPIEDARPRHPVKPELVVSVRYLEWTEEGRLRMAVYRGLRTDVPLTACVAAPEEERVLTALEAGLHPDQAQPQGQVPPASSEPRKVKLSNQSKIFWPKEGYTKGDLLNYYEAVAGVLLPHLKDRPVMLVRYPDGIEGKSFYQWNVPQGTPDWLPVLELRDGEKDGKNVVTFLVNDVDSLLHIVNLGCIPIHVLACREPHLNHCDFLTIDFDLGDQPFKEAVILALSLKDLLQEIGLPGFPKTSGQSGLHVFIPLGKGVPFDVAKVLVELIGRILQLKHPKTSTMERRVRERGSRIYIDTGQTGRSRTIVAPYSVRAYPGARVSTPLFWEEVHLALSPEAWTMFTVPERVREKGDPMAELLTIQPDVASAVAKLEAKVKG